LQSEVGRKVSMALSGGISAVGSITKFASSQRKALSAGMALVGTVGRVWPMSVGPEAIDRTSYGDPGTTILQLTNPASASGVITSVEAWAYETITNLHVGIFYQSEHNRLGTTRLGSGKAGKYTCRDFVDLGQVVAGAKRTFSGLTLTIKAGDLIGYFHADGKIEQSDAGYSGTYDLLGYHMEDGQQEYAYSASKAQSVQGKGTGSS